MQGLTPRSSPAAAAARQQPSVRSRWVITDHGSPFGGRLCSSMHGCLRLWRVQLGGGGLRARHTIVQGGWQCSCTCYMLYPNFMLQLSDMPKLVSTLSFHVAAPLFAGDSCI
jgi:hypothetical protein